MGDGHGRVLETILHHTHMMAAYLDAEFNFVWVNRAYADTCRHEPEFFPGKNHFDLYPNAENQAIFQRVVETGEPFFVAAKVFEFPDQPNRGRTYWDWSLQPVRNDDGDVTGLVFTLAEVTDQKRAEEALRESEERFRYMFELHASVMLLVEPDSGRIAAANDAAARFYGYRKDELSQLTIQDINQLDDDQIAVRRKQALAGDVNAFVFPHRLKSGEVRTVEVHSSRIAHEGDDILFSIVHDITERQNAIRELAASERLLKEIAANYPDAYMSIIQPDMTIGFTSGLEFRKQGLDPEQFVGRTLEQVFGEHAPTVRAHYEKTFAGEERSFELSINDQHQSYRTAPLRGPDGQVTRILAVVQNITDRKEAEAALRESEAFLAAIYQNSAMGVFVVRVAEDGGYTYEGINPQHEKLVGLRNDEVVGRAPDDLGDHLGGATVDYVKALYDECVAKRRTVESEFEVPEGPAKGWWYSRLSPVIEPASNRVVRLIGNGMIVTQLKQTEAALKESEGRLRTLFESNPDYVMLLDREHRIQMINRTLPELEGRELTGTRLYELTSADTRARLKDTLDDVARSGERMRLESAHSRPDGSVVQLDTIVSPVIVDTTVVGSVVSARDVTGERRLKQEKHDLAEQLRQAQKMDAIGRLAGGIAHDFNNLLTIICSYSSFVDEGLAERDPLKADVREIIDASNRATTLIRQLLAFSRKQVLEPRVLDLNAVVLGLEKMLARLIGEHIELRIRLAPELGRVSADPSQLEQILMNLAINARDAMPNGGRLSVATVEREVVPKGEGSVPGIVPGAYVVLTVRDTGVGMSPEVRERVFEPFYTTKDPGQGTGLGLATVYGIVKQSGGEIRVDSTAGLGTVFDIYLPRADEEPPEEQAAAAPSELRGSETLLLVEDERSVRELATRVLTEAGYHVIPASNGIEALAAVERHRGAIHLVVSDVVMPQMGGKELSDRLSSRAHATRVLFMSGYTDDAIARHGVLEEGTHLLSKPFTGATLLRKVRQVLDQD